MKPINNAEVFDKRHAAFLATVRNYGWTMRGRRVLRNWQVEALSLRSSNSMNAINPYVRTAVARAGVEHIRKLTGGGPLSFLTLTPAEFAVPLAAAETFNIAGLHDWVRLRLTGLHYLGMVDAGYFTNFVTGGEKETIAWHAHVLIWGVPAKQINKLIDRLNRQSKSLVPGSDVAVSRLVGSRGALGRWWYLCKSPVSESRVLGAGELVDNETGEITAAMRIRDRPLRPRGAAKICGFMARRPLRSLFLFGGDGAAIHDRIFVEAEGSLCSARAVENRRLLAVLGGTSP